MYYMKEGEDRTSCMWYVSQMVEVEIYLLCSYTNRSGHLRNRSEEREG